MTARGSELPSLQKLPCLSATVFEPQRHREHRGGDTRLRPGANASRCAILVREQRKSRRMPAEFPIWLTAFPLLPDENGGRRRPRAGLGIPVYLCVLCASVVHDYQFLISMNDDRRRKSSVVQKAAAFMLGFGMVLHIRSA